MKVVGQGRVLYDFEPRSTQELGLKANQLVNILNKAGDEHGWWKGELNGRVSNILSIDYKQHVFMRQCWNRINITIYARLRL